ncbi:hypothetical protein CsSME_00003195 [Camellia sinensis var. sinensis]
MDNKTTPELKLPGFRFHPTEEELLNYYLKKIAMGNNKLSLNIIGFLNIYHHEPWELPGLAKIGEREWYFIVPRDRRNGHGGRPNRITQNGFWKATGSDRLIRCLSDPTKILGLRKTLVFYKGRAPRGCKTDWVMNEYRLPDNSSFPKDIVLCKIYRKATSLKVLEERAAIEEKSRILHQTPSSPRSQDSSDHPQESFVALTVSQQDIVFKIEEEEEEEQEIKNVSSSSSLGFGSMKEHLTELEVPKFSMDHLTMDPLWSQLKSPWLGNWSPYYANVLNF